MPEPIDSSSVEETKINREEVRVEDDNDYDEEFYERIEAPKFVDFTKSYTVRADDRYWFCSRVGCDRKHEEEIDPEEISKNFVLRVMAARSPNIKLRRALYREHSSIKCPLSAPAKPSKPRIPRFNKAPSLTSPKNGYPQRKTRPCSKVGSTPVARTRQVAAKYMTTPRNKMCQPNPNSFRSVQNPKPTTLDVVKSRSVAKALVFRSPKKAIVLKKSVELHTPLTKICEGMKRLGLASQKKTVKGSVSKPKKPETEDSSRKQLKTCRSEKNSEDLASAKSTKTKNKKTLTDKCQSLHQQVADVKPSDGFTSEVSKKEDMNHHETSVTANNSHALKAEFNGLSSIEDKENIVCAEDHSNEAEEKALIPHETSEASNSHALRAEINDLSNIEDKENMVTAEDHSKIEGTTKIEDKENMVSAEDHSKIEDMMKIEDKENMVSAEDHSKIKDISDIEDKENMANAEDHSNEVKEKALIPHETSEASNSHALGAEIKDLSNVEDKENMVTEDHSNEVNVGFENEQIDNNRSNQPLGDKMLNKEIHKKNKVVQTAVPGVMKCKKPKPTSIKPFRLRTDERGILKEANLEKKLHIPAPKKEVTIDAGVIKRTYRVTKNENFSNDTARKRPESTQQRSMTSLKTRSQRMPGQQLGVIKEKSSILSSDVTVGANKSRAVSAARSTSRGKRLVTIAKEPNFHASHLPRTCSKIVA
ncbi:uncharacterized protein LOC143585402 [Bidens hawaiensis]|uniref:uncharacterized protein LOC143585402 n=1 Tax=Bidens hawaiensis TaxID=980011 RepID=UPI00404B9B11